MSTDQNKMKEDTRRWFAAFNAHDISECERLADEIYAADYVLHDPGVQGLPPGPAGIKQFTHNVFKNMLDMTTSVDDILAEGERLAYRFTMRYTDRSTGKRMSMQALSIIRYADGKVAEEWELTSPSTPT